MAQVFLGCGPKSVFLLAFLPQLTRTEDRIPRWRSDWWYSLTIVRRWRRCVNLRAKRHIVQIKVASYQPRLGSPCHRPRPKSRFCCRTGDSAPSLSRRRNELRSVFLSVAGLPHSLVLQSMACCPASHPLRIPSYLLSRYAYRQSIDCHRFAMSIVSGMLYTGCGCASPRCLYFGRRRVAWHPALPLSV